MSVSFEPPRRAPRERPLRIDFDELLVPILVGGGLLGYAYYKDDINDIVQEIIDELKNLKLPKPEPIDPNPGPVGGNSGFGSGEVSNHNLQSGGSAWRKEWEVNRRYLNCEFRGYFFIPSSTKRKDGISVKLRGGPHSDSCTKCGCCYIFHVEFSGSNSQNFQKECPHPDYAKNTVGTRFAPGNIKGKWTGVRCSTVNSGNGVRCTMWLDTSGVRGANQWRLWYDILDTGQYGDSSATKPPFTKSPVFGNSPKVIVRIDADSRNEAEGYQMSNATVGEISSSNVALMEYSSKKFLDQRVTVPY